jgi:hypothetical protein
LTDLQNTPFAGFVKGVVYRSLLPPSIGPFILHLCLKDIFIAPVVRLNPLKWLVMLVECGAVNM